MVTFILMCIIIYLLAAGGENGWYNRKAQDGFGRLNRKFSSRGKYSEYGYGMQNENQYGGQNPYGNADDGFGNSNGYGNNFGGSPFGNTGGDMNSFGNNVSPGSSPMFNDNDFNKTDDFGLGRQDSIGTGTPAGQNLIRNRLRSRGRGSSSFFDY